ncbi:MAG: 2-amino-4-hydroxy-6-hydroxymethyldihydropteridine diphosphokinase [Phycisphaerales bacterium]|nr:2-amino-4-hydroxy-6-hydroxymethyldihydropteridine diphosphokinase [Phycisphaerales bacterium]
MSTRTFIALGANLGDRAATIDAAVASLAGSDGVTISRMSSLYETEPIGPAQPRYLNAVCEAMTTLDPLGLLGRLHEIEQGLGRHRERSQRNAPRTIDLDILLFGDASLALPGLTVPHPRMCQRAFVLIPLLEISPDEIVPGDGIPLASFLSALEGNLGAGGVAMWRARAESLR